MALLAELAQSHAHSPTGIAWLVGFCDKHPIPAQQYVTHDMAGKHAREGESAGGEAREGWGGGGATYTLSAASYWHCE